MPKKYETASTFVKVIQRKLLASFSDTVYTRSKAIQKLGLVSIVTLRTSELLLRFQSLQVIFLAAKLSQYTMQSSVPQSLTDVTVSARSCYRSDRSIAEPRQPQVPPPLPTRCLDALHVTAIVPLHCWCCLAAIHKPQSSTVRRHFVYWMLLLPLLLG